MSNENEPQVKKSQSKAALAHRRTLFIEAMIANDGNQKQAAIAAGYSARRATVQGCLLMRDPAIREAIEKRRAEVVAEAKRVTGLSVERTLLEVARLSYSDLADYLVQDGRNRIRLRPIEEWTPEMRAAVKSLRFDTKGRPVIELHEKNPALEKAMKHLGQFEKDNRQQPTPPATTTVIVSDNPVEAAKAYQRLVAGK